MKEKDELLQKIGRNLLLFQQVEQLLKNIVACSTIETNATGLTERSKKRKEGIHKSTLGKVASQYLEDVHVNEKSDEIVGDTETYCVTIRNSINVDPVDMSTKIETFKMLVNERNKLVHHLLPDIDFDSELSMMAVAKMLDEQRERILPVIDELKSINRVFAELLVDAGKILTSDRFFSEIQSIRMSGSPVIALLRQLATEAGGSDGWILLSDAGKALHKALPAEMQSLKSKYGEKNLKAIMDKSGIFEFKDEPTPKGGIRSFYRNRIA